MSRCKHIRIYIFLLLLVKDLICYESLWLLSFLKVTWLALLTCLLLILKKDTSSTQRPLMSTRAKQIYFGHFCCFQWSEDRQPRHWYLLGKKQCFVAEKWERLSRRWWSGCPHIHFENTWDSKAIEGWKNYQECFIGARDPLPLLLQLSEDKEKQDEITRKKEMPMLLYITVQINRKF